VFYFVVCVLLTNNLCGNQKLAPTNQFQSLLVSLNPPNCTLYSRVPSHKYKQQITNTGKYDSCQHLFKQLQTLTHPSQYMFSLLVSVAKNRHLFLSNSDIHDKNTRHNFNLHLPTTILTLVQKGVLYSRSRIYNHSPTHIKRLSHDLTHFKSKQKTFP
jgi:hypothetical protein